MVSLVELKTAINTSLAPEKMVVEFFCRCVFLQQWRHVHCHVVSIHPDMWETGHGTLFVQQSILKKGLLWFLNMPSKNPSSNTIGLSSVILLICDNVCMFSVEKVHWQRSTWGERKWTHNQNCLTQSSCPWL